MPRTCDSTASICRALSSSTVSDGPTTLTVFSPLTPESASSTLSWMFWEKLKSIPGNSLANRSDRIFVSWSLSRPCFQVSKGFRGTKSSMLFGPLTSVPSSGRPTWETTVSTSGRSRRMSRMRRTYCVDCGSETDRGSVARIQKLPSSSFGMNSRPTNGKRAKKRRTGISPSAAASFGRANARSVAGT